MGTVVPPSPLTRRRRRRRRQRRVTGENVHGNSAPRTNNKKEQQSLRNTGSKDRRRFPSSRGAISSKLAKLAKASSPERANAACTEQSRGGGRKKTFHLISLFLQLVVATPRIDTETKSRKTIGTDRLIKQELKKKRYGGGGGAR